MDLSAWDTWPNPLWISNVVSEPNIGLGNSQYATRREVPFDSQDVIPHIRYLQCIF